MLLLRWSNNNVIHGSQRRYVLHRTKVVRLEKRELCSCWVSLAQSEARSLKWRRLRRRLQKYRFPRLTAMWSKCCDACKKKSVRCNRKATFHYKGKLREVFRAGLNDIKYDYIPNNIFIYSIMLQPQTWKHFAKNKRLFKQWCTAGFPPVGTN